VNLNFYFSYNGMVPDELLSVDEIQTALHVMDKHARSDLQGRLMLGSPIPYCFFPETVSYLRSSCSPGWMYAGIDATGDVRMCPWSSRTLGNVLDTPLTEIWQNSTELRHYRACTWLDGACKECSYVNYCLGGCRVTSNQPPYSLAAYWKPFVRPFSEKAASA